jgi:hypothetical protein
MYTDALEEECGDVDLVSRIFSNRAIVQFKLKNFKSCIQDCRKAIETKPDFIKPYLKL